MSEIIAFYESSTKQIPFVCAAIFTLFSVLVNNALFVILSGKFYTTETVAGFCELMTK